MLRQSESPPKNRIPGHDAGKDKTASSTPLAGNEDTESEPELVLTRMRWQ
jgi:hypothetical protein